MINPPSEPATKKPEASSPSVSPLLIPRTPADFARLDRFVERGITNEEFFRFMTTKNWRSEVIRLPDGTLACALCVQQLRVPNTCEECGQEKLT